MKDFIDKIKKKIGFTNDAILEKSINAFTLLEILVEYLPNLIFKGGTSILLRQFPPLRFSVDIDIILHEKEKDNIEEIFKIIIDKLDNFVKCEPDDRRNTERIEHYYFYFNSIISNKEEYVLLDILYSDNPYFITDDFTVDIPILISGNDFKVKIPSIDGIFADKLVAIADNELGVSLNDQFEMQYVKQVVDLYILFPLLSNVEDLFKTFNKVLAMENSIHNTRIDANTTLNSIQMISIKFAKYLLKGSDNKDAQLIHINNGLRRLSSHLVERINYEKLKEAYGKIAYITKLIIDNDTNVEIEKRSSAIDKYDVEFYNDFVILNTLIKTNPIAYHYFLKTFGK